MVDMEKLPFIFKDRRTGRKAFSGDLSDVWIGMSASNPDTPRHCGREIHHTNKRQDNHLGGSAFRPVDRESKKRSGQDLPRVYHSLSIFESPFWGENQWRFRDRRFQSSVAEIH